VLDELFFYSDCVLIIALKIEEVSVSIGSTAIHNAKKGGESNFGAGRMTEKSGKKAGIL